MTAEEVWMKMNVGMSDDMLCAVMYIVMMSNFRSEYDVMLLLLPSTDYARKKSSTLLSSIVLIYLEFEIGFVAGGIV